MKRWQILPFAILATTGLLAGCSGGDSGTKGSTLSISLMDAPVDGVTAVYVKITGMWIKPMGSGPAVELPMPNGPMTVNIMGLTSENAAILVDNAAIEAGSYEWIAMDIAAEPNVRDSYVITNGGAEEEVEPELKVPSNRLRLVGGFTVPENQAVRLLFDWSMRQGLVYPPGQHQYFLKPAFRMLDVTAYGALQGTISHAWVADPLNNCNDDDTTNQNFDVGNVVYVFSGKGATVDDVDGTDDPVATIETTVDPVTGDYVYHTLIDPGDYTVAFTCQAANDEPAPADDALTFLPAVDITNTGDVSTVDFPAAP